MKFYTINQFHFCFQLNIDLFCFPINTMGLFFRENEKLSDVLTEAQRINKIENLID